MRIARSALLAAIVVLPVGAQQPAPTDRGRQLTADFYAGNLQVIWDRYSKNLQEAFGSVDALRGFRAQVENQLGAETDLLSEQLTTERAVTTYARLARFEKTSLAVAVKWMMGADGTVVGFSIRPQTTKPSDEFLNYETRTPLHLPFEGDWFVFWGGRELAQNYHAATRDQRFAYDLVIVKSGLTHAGDGRKNDDYHCFGVPILAPAAGIVHTVKDGIPDNVPGEMNAAQPIGNHVIIDHGNGEYSFLAHFRKGTVKIAGGQQVETGQVLGMCGNSGNSSEPHLHYHLQNTPVFLDGDGLPAPFLDYIANGEPVPRGEPIRGQHIVRSPPRPAPQE